jgi:hypothetical protein
VWRRGEMNTEAWWRELGVKRSLGRTRRRERIILK